MHMKWCYMCPRPWVASLATTWLRKRHQSSAQTYHIPQYAQMHIQLSPTEPPVSHSRAEAPIANGDRVAVELVFIDTDLEVDH